MRILQVTLGFYPAQSWGGPVNVVRANGKELTRRGHRVTVYCSNLWDKDREMRPETFEDTVDGMRVVYFKTWRIRRWPGTLGPHWLPDLASYLKREVGNFDIVHLNGYRSPIMLTAANAARRAGVPIVTQPHGTLPVIVNSFALKRAYDRIFGRRELTGIGALIALEEQERQQALSHGVPYDRIEIIPNGIDPAERKSAPERGTFRRRFGLDDHRPLILFLARINWKKGTDMLIEAFARMRGVEAQLAIAGPDDGQLAEVRGLIAKFGLQDRVTITGLLTGADVLGAFQDADLFVLPCRSDAFPFAMVESCLMGTPMVITDRCEIADMIKGRIGDVTPFDADAFALAMERLITDRNRLEKYRANCQTMLEQSFSLRSVVDRLESVYERVKKPAEAALAHGAPRRAARHEEGRLA
jgi:glycosyltransferase involved in cell wall biosynthesis